MFFTGISSFFFVANRRKIHLVNNFFFSSLESFTTLLMMNYGAFALPWNNQLISTVTVLKIHW